MRDRNKSSDLLKAFRESRQQIEKPVENSVDNVDKSKKTFTRGYSETRKRNTTSDKVKTFEDKYAHLEDTVDSFTTSDLVYFFREKAHESGVKYVIANMKRDMGIFKKLQASYTPREICLMIEFIFTSNQNYLDITNTQPTVLVSSYCNKIYRDSLLWADDKYYPDEPRPTKKQQIQKREWKNDIKGESATIGAWGEDE